MVPTKQKKKKVRRQIRPLVDPKRPKKRSSIEISTTSTLNLRCRAFLLHLLRLPSLPSATHRRLTGRKHAFPELRTFTINPKSGDRVALEIAVDISETFLEQLQERVPERRVHADHFAWMIGSNAVAGQGFFEQGCMWVAAEGVMRKARET